MKKDIIFVDILSLIVEKNDLKRLEKGCFFGYKLVKACVSKKGGSKGLCLLYAVSS